MRLTHSVLLLLLALPMAGQPQAFVADYMEDRSNRVFGCYCEWSSENIISGREAILAWLIRSGCYRGVELAGVSLAAVIEGEDTLSRGHPPRKSVLILDESATATQRRAAEAWVRERHGDMLGTVVRVYTMPVSFVRTAEKASLTVGQFLQLEMRRARPETDALQGSVHWYDPFIPMSEATLGTTLRSKYAGGEFSHRWDWSDPGITGYYGTVRLELNDLACARHVAPPGP